MNKNSNQPLRPGIVDPQGFPATARPAGVHQADVPGVPAVVNRPDQSLVVPSGVGPAGSQPFGPVPVIGSANVPIGAPDGEIPVWPAPSLSAQTPRDPSPATLMSEASPNHQALVDAARSRMDPQFRGSATQPDGYTGPAFDPDAHPLRGGSR